MVRLVATVKLSIHWSAIQAVLLVCVGVSTISVATVTVDAINYNIAVSRDQATPVAKTKRFVHEDTERA